MTATINASTTAGVVTTADTSGILQLQTNGTAALTVDASQRTAFVAGTAALPAITTTGDTNTGIFFPAADTIAFAEGGAEAARLDSSGNFGLGVTPSAWDSTVRPVLSVKASTGSFSFGASGVDNARFLANAYYSGGFKRVAAGHASQYEQNAGTHIWYTAGTSTADSAITFTEAARIDSSGNLLVGTTSVLGTSAAGTTHITGGANDANEAPLYLRNQFSTAGRYWKVGPTNNAGFIIFTNSNVGQYQSYGATSWTATSDERLKTNLLPIENAAQKVSSLRAVTGRYKTDEQNVSRSFLIAQDVQAVFPEAVDVQDDEQNTLGLRYTEVIPLLVAAIQELKAIVDAQGAEIAALKGATA